MFSIGFTDEPLEYPYDDIRVPAAPGLLIIGKTMEGLLANLAKWNKETYESQWKSELRFAFERQRQGDFNYIIRRSQGFVKY